ncbi:MAG TPA: ATP phosphoribosyltransferase regulatory subunit, partial [Kofleriaceae bacterium]|nr:ATP phosphoribosyltransferase regulatory subunit [Kofleriaceae bacterium]
VITPAFEYEEVLALGLGDAARAATFRFVEPSSGEVVALRPDITPQVARIAATRMAEIDGPIRFCYEGAVTRLAAGPRVQREILQAGVELIDAPSPEGDAEVIAVAAAALADSGVDHVRLDVGHVAPAREALAAVADADRRAELRALLATRDRAGVARAAAAGKLAPALRAVLEALPTLYGAPRPVLRRARELPLPRRSKAALDALEQVLAMTRDVLESAVHAQITVDLGEVRGFEYYTGIRFAGYVRGAGDAVLRGGRYDELVARYGRTARATGFAVDIEAMAEAQAAAGVATPGGAASVLIAAGPERRREAARVAAALRAAGAAAAVDLGGRRGRRQLLAYARGVGFTRVLSLDDEPRWFDVTAGVDGDHAAGTAVAPSALRRPAALISALNLRKKVA